MSDSCILIVEEDLLVTTPLAEYLRECGYLVAREEHLHAGFSEQS